MAQPAARAANAGEYRVAPTDRTALVQIAATGVRWTGLTFFSHPDAGRPPSREKAKTMREIEVRPASAHQYFATTMPPASSSLSAFGAGRLLNRLNQESAPSLAAAARSWIA